MKTMLPPKTKRHGFSLIELLVVIAGIGILSGGGYVAVSGIQQTAAASKLQNDVAAINRAIDVYRANGGSIDGISGAVDSNHGIDVLMRLKQKGTAGLGTVMESQSAVIDPRIKAEWLADSEAGDSQVRAVWDTSGKKFVLTNSGSGIKRFVMDDAAAAAAASLATVARTSTKQTAATGWHWDYSTATPGERYSGFNPTAALTEAQTQNFGNAPWVVGPDGTVSMSYVYRGAGYSGTLALVSLEGMGSANYNLDTAEGQRQFLMELMRRVVDSDRGQVVIDVSKDKPVANTTANQTLVVKDKEFTFRPGDTVAALLIPNGTFQQALMMLQGLGDITDNPDALYQLANNTYKGDKSSNKEWVQSVTGKNTSSSQLFGITSLSRENTTSGSNFPFYEEKFAAIGTNTDTYALEDLIINSDQDYEDIIFKAVGLQATGTFANVITDPYTYYKNKNRWNQTSTGGGVTLGTALINAGIVDPSTIPPQ